jgi:tripartite-type tricarboxylate transporter receptor subunit TctC
MSFAPRQFVARLVAVAACSALLGTVPGRAGEVTKIAVPFAAGGGTDIIARTLAQEMAKELDATVIVENKPGAGTVIGTDFVAKAEPDGRTLLMATFAHAVNPSLRARLPYDNDRDFVPVSLIARSYNLVVVSPDSGIASIADLITRAKANPDALNYGTFGPGTSAHLAGELFKSLAQVRMTAVHYKGAAPAITDLLGGTIQVMFTTASSAASLVKEGRLRALAVTSTARSSSFPDVPTVAETGIAGYAAESWYGLFAPARTSATVIDRLNTAVDRAIRAPAFDRLVENEGLMMVGGAPQALALYVQGEELRWRKVVRDTGITIE